MEKFKFEIINKTKNCKLLVSDGYTFMKNKGNSEKYWKCREKSCKSNGKVIGAYFIYTNSKHEHPKNAHEGEKVKAVKEMKELISIANLKPKAAFENVRARYPYIEDELIFSKLKSTLEKVRAKTGLKDPKDIEEFCEMLEVDENATRYGLLPDGDSFYHSYVNLGQDGEMLVFVNMKTLRKAEKNENIAADGTFFITPTLFKQVYMIHFLYKEKALSFCYALMTKKSVKLYLELFKILKDMELSPKSISIDFEFAAIKASKEVWPEIKIEGCFFHFSKSVKKYVNTKCPDLKSAILNDSHPSKYLLVINKIRALALVPMDHAERCLEIIENDINNLENASIMNNFLNYFETFWINKIGFKNFNVSNAYKRTNNDVELVHHHLKKNFGKGGNVWNFLEKLIKESESKRADFFAYKNGVPPKKKYGRITRDDLIIDAQKRLMKKRINESDFLNEIASLTNKVIDCNFNDLSDFESEDDESIAMDDYFEKEDSVSSEESPVHESPINYVLVTPSQKKKSSYLAGTAMTPKRKTAVRKVNLKNNF